MGIIVSLQDVSKVFPGTGDKSADPVTAVSGVSLDIEQGRIVGIVGYSGAGKSTLVRLINALERPTSGRIVVDGEDITDLPENRLRRVRGGIGMIFQQFNLLKSRTVAGNVAYPLKVAGWPKQRVQERVAEMLDFVGIGDKAKRYPRRLSGGQQQRVGIARALATGPRILLADEATSALDPETTAEVLDLLRRINQDFGTTIVVITHEMSVVREICDVVVMMENGRIIEQGETYSVFANPRTEATRRFVSTALHGQPGPETLARIAAAHAGPILGIGITQEASTSVVSEIFARHGVAANVVYGGITEVQNRSLGTLTFAVDSDRTTLDPALEELHRLTEVRDLTPQKNVGGSAAQTLEETVSA